MVGYRSIKPESPDAEYFLALTTRLAWIFEGINYDIHIHPAKHGLVEAPRDWMHSSFHRYAERGIYQADWADGGQIFAAGAEYDR